MTSGSRLEKVLEKGEFAVTSECGPPRGADAGVIRGKGELLKGYVDAVNVTDNQTSVVRMSSFASCIVLKEMGFQFIAYHTDMGLLCAKVMDDLQWLAKHIPS